MKVRDRILQVSLGFDSVILYPLCSNFSNKTIMLSLFILSLGIASTAVIEPLQAAPWVFQNFTRCSARKAEMLRWKLWIHSHFIIDRLDLHHCYCFHLFAVMPATIVRNKKEKSIPFFFF